MEYATALEVALGGIVSLLRITSIISIFQLTNIVVKTRNAAKILLDKGNLERRVTFIPLDNLKFTPLKTCQLDRAIELVGRENVSLAVDLVDFDESNRNAVEYALGNTLVCTTPDAAKAVCFDRGIRTRVVTFEGDDYRPDGFLTGGSNQRRSSILSDIQTFLQIQLDINKLNQDSKSINGKLFIYGLITLHKLPILDQLINIQERQKEKNQLELKRSDLTNEIRQIEGQIRADPSINLSEKIEKLKAEIKKNEDELEQIGPVVEELAEKLRVIEDRQRNEVAYRKKERKKAEDGLKEAESMMKELSTNSVNMIKKLELDKLEVETLEMQILGDEEDLRKQEQNRCLTIGERDAIKENVKELKVCLKKNRKCPENAYIKLSFRVVSIFESKKLFLKPFI
jgi:structural maintenance of chromosome 2